MKNSLYLSLLLLGLISCISTEGGSSNTISSEVPGNNVPRFTGVINDSSLNSAIVESYIYIKNKVNNGTVIGIANFNSPTKELSDYYVDGLSKQIVDEGKYKLVDIGNLRIIEQEMTRQLNGNVSDETAKRIGQQYGTDFIIIGNITQLGTTKTYRIKITITNVETTQIQGIYYADIRSNNELAKFLPENSNSKNLPLQNTTNPDQRIYYYRNITLRQFNDLSDAFKIEARGSASGGSFMNANLIDGGISDPYISFEIKRSGIAEVKIVGPYYTEVYTYGFPSSGNTGAQQNSDVIMRRFIIEKNILDGKYGNPNISMFFMK